MVITVTIPPIPPPTAELASRLFAREGTKEFVRRPAKGWTGSVPVPVVRFDHHCEVWQER